MVKIKKNKIVNKLAVESKYASEITLTISDKINVSKTNKGKDSGYTKYLSTIFAVIYALPTKVTKSLNSLSISASNAGFTIFGELPSYSFVIQNLPKEKSDEIMSLDPEGTVEVPKEFEYFCKLFGLKQHGNVMTNGVFTLTITFGNASN